MAIQSRSCVAILIAAALMLLASPSFAADAKEVKLEPAQQEAANKLRAKGAAVLQIAADTDALSVNLGIIGKQATDDDLALVKVLPKVAQLDAHGTSVTDAGLANIAGFTSLTHLHLNNTGITDAGMAHLKGLTSLYYLNLYGTGVTDAGVKNLEGIKSLRKLYLWQTKVSDAGSKGLNSAIPEIAVNRGEDLVLPPPPATKPADPKEAKPATPEKPATPAKPEPKKPGKKKPAAPAAAPAAADIDAEGFIKTWLVFGPIPLEGQPADELDKAQLADEGKLSPKAGDKAKAGSKELAWQKVTAGDFFLDFNQILKAENESNVAVYAVAYLESADEQSDATLLFSTNDEGKVFLNGKELGKFKEGRTLEKDSDKVPGVTLKKGTNVVVLKVINESNNWQGCVRFTDKAGKPLAGLKIKTAP